MLFHGRVDLLELGLGRRLELELPGAASSGELARLVEALRDAAAHARAEVLARGPEDDDRAAGHVLAAVIADALDDGERAAVADGEALARAPGEERLAARRAVEARVADDDLVLGAEARARGRTHGEDAARESLADVVVRVALEHEQH